MQIAIVGTGYVGLVTGACLAELGHRVICIDTDRRKIEDLCRGTLPIFEPGLEAIVANVVSKGRLAFSNDIGAAQTADVAFIAVGTPTRPHDGHADLSYVYAAARALVPALKPGAILVIKSTVPVGTADEVERIVYDMRSKSRMVVASNPEFLRAGSAVEDFQRPDRLVIGTEDERARAALDELYAPLGLSAERVLMVGRRTAELIKYASNAFLATKIAFINEIADLCERVGAEVGQVTRGLGLDRRIGPQALTAGPGFGGSCFPKDALALAKMGQDYEAGLTIVEAAIGANQRRKRAMARKVAAALGGSARGCVVGLLGLTFKPNTDDMREAPSLAIATALLDMGARVQAYDPAGMSRAKLLLPEIALAASPYEAARHADALVVITEWDEFRALSLPRIKRMMVSPLIVDLRNIFSVDDMRRHGFAYHAVGTKPLESPVTPLARAYRGEQRTPVAAVTSLAAGA